jgi:hypothetical protein
MRFGVYTIAYLFLKVNREEKNENEYQHPSKERNRQPRKFSGSLADEKNPTGTGKDRERQKAIASC